MPGMNFNRRKRPAHGASGKGLLHSRLAQRAIAIVGALALAFFGLTAAVVYADGADFGDLTSDPVGTVARAYQNALGLGRAAGDESAPVADDMTVNSWKDYMNASVATNGTANVGRIWTDKSVSTGDIKLDPNGGTITKAKSSDFLVALSALSSTSNKVTYTDKPLDIVLVLDRSGSMEQNRVSDTAYYPVNDIVESDYNKFAGIPTGGSVAPQYYALVDGKYVEIEEQVDDNSILGTGSVTHEAWRLNGQNIEPITDPNDTEGKIQFYRGGNLRIDALKAAVSQFIDQTEAANANISDANSRHRISIVSYENNATVNAQLTTCYGDGADDLKRAVENIEAGGGTSPQDGMSEARDILNNDARSNAQKVVIFFADGEADSNSQASQAVSIARGLKTAENPTIIYSVGIFENANPDNDPADQNTQSSDRFMHAMSSNYPNATANDRNSLGQRAENTQGEDSYYKAATDAESLSQVFEQIAEDMQTGAVGVPTEVDTDHGFNMSNDGYITFTDTLGAYMDVNPEQNFTVVYKNTPYTAQYDANGGAYTMPDVSVEGNYTDKDGGSLSNINQIKISVAKSTNPALQGDTVTVQIPASLIPLLHYNVKTEDGETTVTSDPNETFPIRALYGVKVVDNIDDIMIQQLGDESSDLNTYLKGVGNTSEDGTQVYLYSNNWTRPTTADGTTATGSTTASFEPSTKNAFYYFQEDTPVYTDEACTQPATQDDLGGSGSLWYKFTYDKAGTATENWEAVEVSKANFVNHPDYYGIKGPYDQLNNDEIRDGQVYIKTGKPRLSRASDFNTAKADASNKTHTATQALSPSWNGDAINVALGNNGRIGIEMPGSLAISKDVVTPAGFPQEDVAYHESVDFDFKIHVDGASGSYTAAVVEDGQTTPVDGGIKFTDGGATYKLHDGQQLIIYGLNNGAHYTVTEDAEGGYDTEKTGDTGTIAAAETAQAAFTNTYKVTTPATVKGSTDLTGTKAIDGRAWVDDESYTFVLAQLQSGTTDDAGTAVDTVVVKGDPNKGEDPIKFNFKDLSFDTPGVYRYTIYENDAQSTIPAGVSASRARYRVTITVTDNHDGTLKAETTIQQTRRDDGTALDPWGEPGTAKFVNTYQVGETEATIQANKKATSAVGGDYGIDNDDFQFELKPVGDTAATAPMPDDAEGEGAGRVAKMTNTGTTAQFGITFDNYDFPEDENTAVFWYELTEDDTYNPVPGMDYSEQVYYAKVTIVRATDESGKAVIKTTVEYFTDADGTQAAPDNQALFTNTFDPDDVTTTEDGDTSIHGTKTVDGRNWNGDSYTFTIAEAEGYRKQDGVKMPDDCTVTVADNDDQNPKVKDTAYPFAFNGITFSKVGTYHFTITETPKPDDAKGMKYDTHETDVTVTVGVDAEAGKLKIENITYDNKDVVAADNSQAVYKNEYSASTDFGDGETGGIQVVKTLDGRALRAGEFSFTVKGIDGTGTTAEEANAKLENGDRLFGNEADGTMQIFMGDGFKFNQDDAGKTFSFVVDELSTQDEITAAGSQQTIKPNVTYDPLSYRVDLAVVDKGDGTMHVVTTITPCDAAGEPTGDDVVYTGNTDDADYTIPTVTFENRYAPDAATYDTSAAGLLNKVITGRDWLESDSFEFTIAADDSVESNLAAEAMPDPATVTVSSAGAKNGQNVSFGFGTLTFNKPGTYVYKVTEAKAGTTEGGLTYADNVATLKFKVEDNPNTGDLVVTNTSSIVTDGTFTNTYEASVDYDAVGGLNIQKTLENHALTEGQFTFEAQVLNQDGDPVGDPVEWKNPAPEKASANTVTWSPFDQPLTFDQDDAGQTIRFTVTEKNGGAEGYTYDGAKYTVEITPIDNHDGTMSVHTKVTKDGVEKPVFDQTTSADAHQTAVPDFTNTYGTDATTGDVAADVKATKTLTGRNMKADEFNFEIVTRDADPDDGAAFTSTKVATGTNAAAKDGEAGKATFTGTNEAMTYTIDKLDQAVADGYATKELDDKGNATWTLYYSAQEKTDKLPAKVTAENPTSFDFTVTIVDNGDGTLEATVNAPENGIAFQNTYTPDDVTVGKDGDAQITVHKTFTGRPDNEWRDTDSFEFTIAADESTPDAPLPGTKTVELSSDDEPENGVATDIFGDITYTKADLGGAMTKNFVYTITETSPAENGSGITKDTHTAKVTVTVTDDGTGQLAAKVTYDNNEAANEADKAVTNAAAFTNTYKASEGGKLDGATYLKASKTLTGRAWQNGEQVDIVLRGDKGTPAPTGTPETDADRWTYAMHVSEDGSFNFPDIEYAADDLGGKESAQFTYVIRELSDTHTVVDGSDAEKAQIKQGMDYALDTYHVVVTVRDAHDGTLDVSAQMFHVRNHDGDYVTGDATGELVADNTAAFENQFDADAETLELTASKVYADPNNGKPMTDGMFSFRVTAVGDEAATAPMGDRVQTDDQGNRYIDANVDIQTKDASFGTAKFQFDGHNHTFYYEVTENMPAGANEGNGYKVDGVTYDPTTFTVKVEVTYDDQTLDSKAVMSIYKGTYEEVSKADADALAPMKVDGITFNNSYGTGGTTVDTGDAQTTATFYKVIDGRRWLDSDSFQFTITPNDGAPAFEGASGNGASTVTVTKDNPEATLADPDRTARSFNFGTVTFTDKDMTGAQMVDGKPTKTFTYTVKETAGDIAGMTYDSDREATLTIIVVDNGNGTMTATPQVQNGVFTNTYSTSVDYAAAGGFQITKTLTGRDMTAGQFEFTVKPVDGTSTSANDAAAKLGIDAGGSVQPSPEADDGTKASVATFPLAGKDMTFTQDDAGKTFAYEVSETKKGGEGYTNDDATYRVEISVAHEPSTATLTVTTTVKDANGAVVGEPVVVTNATAPADRAVASVDFKNSYAASTDPGVGGTPATVSTTKTLVNRPLEAGEFTFQVAYAGGDQAVVKSDVTNAADGTVDFGSFEYDTASLAEMVKARYTEKVTNEDGLPSWTIQYTASEVTDGLPAEGVSASKPSFDFTITVVDKGDGTLIAKADLPEGHGFENTYSTNDGEPVSVTPTGNKVFDHAEGLEPNIAALAGEYTFTLEPVTEGAPMPEGNGNVTTNDEYGNVTFGAIEFTLDDLNNALAAQEGANAEEGIDTQELDGQPRKFTFEYQVTEAETNPGTIDYVTVDTEPKTIKYTVHDDGHGVLTVTSDPANAPLFTFTNTYSVEPVESSPTGDGQLTITKTLAGRDMHEGEFTFVLTAPDGTQYTATNAAAADGETGAVTFDPITFDKPGIYQYTLAEKPGEDNVGLKYDPHTYTVTADVEDNHVGGLDVTWSINGTEDKTIAFENTYEAAPASMGFGATKVLTGRDLEEGEFTFQITNEAGDALYAEATNDATGTVNFDPMAFKQAGEYHLWISEVLPEDDDAATDGIQSENVTYDESRYELVVTVKDDGKGQLQVTNVAMADGSEPAPVFQNTYTKPEEPAKPVLPGGDTLEQTGDTMPLLLGVATVAGVALVAGGLAVRRKRGE